MNKNQCALEALADDRPFVCPLSQVREGSCVRIKSLSAPPTLVRRLRELGLREKQEIRLLSQQRSLICEVCNARLGLSADLADSILVEPLSGPPQAP